MSCDEVQEIHVSDDKQFYYILTSRQVSPLLVIIIQWFGLHEFIIIIIIHMHMYDHCTQGVVP